MTREKPDYTNSAENLCNPEEVKALLTRHFGLKGSIAEMEKELEADPAYRNLVNSQAQLLELEKEIKKAIETYGSYQDIEGGHYAVKYRRLKKGYHVEPFKKQYPQFIPAVVEEAINVKALEGLVKGNLITEEHLKVGGVITEEAQYAFFIR